MIQESTAKSALSSLVFLLFCTALPLAAEPSVAVRLGEPYDFLENRLTGQTYRLDLRRFVLVVGPQAGNEKKELRLSDFAVQGQTRLGPTRWEAFHRVLATADGGWRVDLRKGLWKVSVFLHINQEKGLVYKWLEVEHTSDQPQIVWECRLLETGIEVEQKKKDWVPARLNLSFSGPEDRVAGLGGYGVPVFVGSLFYGTEFPLHRSRYDEEQRLFYSQYNPAEVLPPNTTLRTERLVMGVAGPPAPASSVSKTARGPIPDPVNPEREAAAKAFREYLDSIAWRNPSEPFYYYNSWGAHEYEGPSSEILREQLDRMEDLRDQKIKYDYFIIDAGFTSRNLKIFLEEDYRPGDLPDDDRYFDVDPGRFPGDSFSESAARIRDLEMKAGVWVNAGCVADREHMDKLERGLIDLYDDSGISWILVDFVVLSCADSTKPHATGKYGDYGAARNVMRLIRRLREHAPDYAFYLTSLGQSPWWLPYADFVVHGSEHQSAVPAPSNRLSHILANDFMHFFWCLDAGVLLDHSDSDYYQGTESFLEGVLMSVARQAETIYLGGDLALLDKEDEEHLGKLFERHRSKPQDFAVSRPVVSYSGPDRIYGYVAGSSESARERRAANLFLYNSGWSDDQVDIPFSELVASGAPGVGVELVYGTGDKPAFSRDEDSLTIYLPAWSVAWIRLETNSDVQTGIQPDLPELFTASSWPLGEEHLKRLASGSPSSLTVPLQMFFFLGSGIWKKQVDIPQAWEGFPLVFLHRQAAGELYIDTWPLRNRDDDSLTVVWPGTPAYERIRFGKPNEIFYAFQGSPQIEEATLDIRAAEFYEFELSEEQTALNRGLWLTAAVNYLKDGATTTEKPVYRHSDDLAPDYLGSSSNPVFGQVAFYGDAKIEDISGFPPLIPRVWSGYPWSLQRYQLSGDEGRIRLIIPRLAEGVDYKVDVMLTR